MVGMTGGGKTVTLEKVVDAYHHDKTAEYINIIVDCGGSYDKAARLYDPEEVFTFRYSPSEALGLDPFAFGSSSEEERVDDICETLWLIIKPGCGAVGRGEGLAAQNRYDVFALAFRVVVARVLCVVEQ